jgi:hypothetical protein
MVLLKGHLKKPFVLGMHRMVDCLSPRQVMIIAARLEREPPGPCVLEMNVLMLPLEKSDNQTPHEYAPTTPESRRVKVVSFPFLSFLFVSFVEIQGHNQTTPTRENFNLTRVSVVLCFLHYYALAVSVSHCDGFLF